MSQPSVRSVAGFVAMLLVAPSWGQQPNSPIEPPVPTSPPLLAPQVEDEIPGTIDLDTGGAFQPPPINQFNSGRQLGLGAVQAGFSASPAMIGDLFNAGTSSLNFTVRMQADAAFAGTVNYANPAQLMSGFVAPINGFTVTALDPVGDLVQVGDSTFLDLTDIAPINSVQIRATDDAATVNNADLFGGTLTAGAPLSNSDIFHAADNAVARELSQTLANDVSTQELATLEFLERDSTLQIDGAADEVTAASFIYRIGASIPVPSPGEVIGRYSIADNNSPFPRDRLFLDYNFFHNARISSVGIPVNRWAPGFEKTFLDGTASIELRLPMAITLNSQVSTTGDNLIDYEFGDLAVSAKTLLFQSNVFAFTVGMGITVPTADDFTLTMSDGTTAILVDNQSVHLLPYTAFIVQPTRDTFIQSFAQLDVDLSGNRVLLDEDAFLQQGPSGLASAGRLHGQTLLRWNTSAGVYLLRRPSNRLSAIAGVLESHYTATLNRADRVGSENFSVGDPNHTLNVLNLTTGLHFYCGETVATVGYGVPVTSDRVFDGELRVFVNRYF